MPRSRPLALGLLFLGAHPPDRLPEGESPSGLPSDNFKIVTKWTKRRRQLYPVGVPINVSSIDVALRETDNYGVSGLRACPDGAEYGRSVNLDYMLSMLWMSCIR